MPNRIILFSNTLKFKTKTFSSFSSIQKSNYFKGDGEKTSREDKLKKMNKWVTGSVGLSLTTYNVKSSLANERPTLDPFNYRFFANVTLKLSDKFSLPFSISVSYTHLTLPTKPSV